jgi:hypothetical protein
MSSADIQVLRNDLAALLAELRQLREEKRKDAANFSAAFVELQSNVQRIVTQAVKRIDALPCMGRKKTK